MNDIRDVFVSSDLFWFWMYCAVLAFGILFSLVHSRQKNKNNTITLTTHSYLKRFVRTKHWGWQAGLVVAGTIFILFGWILFVSSKNTEETRFPSRNATPNPVVLVLADISSSMGTGSSFTPNPAKQRMSLEVYEKVVARGLATGLILYSDSAYLARFPTKDPDISIRNSLDEETLKGPLQFVIRGTDTASAITLARQFLLEFFPDSTFVIVLISDLSDNPILMRSALSRFATEVSSSEFYVVQVGLPGAGTESVATMLRSFGALHVNMERIENLGDIGKLDAFFASFPEDEGVSGGSSGSHDANSEDGLDGSLTIFLLGTVIFGITIGYLLLREILIRKAD